MSAASEPRLMPPKVRELVAELEGAGFVNRGPFPCLETDTISGKLGDDAKQYQIPAVRAAIAEVER